MSTIMIQMIQIYAVFLESNHPLKKNKKTVASVREDTLER